MTPSAAIGMLDEMIALHGQSVTLRRTAGGITADVGIRAFVREYKPEEIVGGIAQGDTMIVLSPTQVAGSPFAESILRNDKVVIRGRVRNVHSAEPVLVDDQLVRINLQVRG